MFPYVFNWNTIPIVARWLQLREAEGDALQKDCPGRATAKKNALKQMLSCLAVLKGKIENDSSFFLSPSFPPGRGNIVKWVKLLLWTFFKGREGELERERERERERGREREGTCFSFGVVRKQKLEKDYTILLKCKTSRFSKEHSFVKLVKIHNMNAKVKKYKQCSTTLSLHAVFHVRNDCPLMHWQLHVLSLPCEHVNIKGF